MNKLVLAICLIPGLIPSLVSAAVVGGGAAAATMMAVSAAHSDAVRRYSEAAKHPADCADCHRELFPFDLPSRCAISSDPFDCWRERHLDGRIMILTRDAGRVRRVYRLKLDYGSDRVFLPSADGTNNPHYVLEER